MSEDTNINKDGEENPGRFRKPEGFDFPEDYFNSFSSRLFKKLGSENELAEFKLLAALPKIHPFVVPDNYFLTLEHKTELAAYPGLASVKPGYPVEVEAGYFEKLAQSLQYKIALAEELKEYGRLAAIEKVNPFDVEEAYFDTLTSAIQDRLFAPQAPGLVERLLELFFTRKTAYAFGAVALLGFSIMYFNRADTGNTGTCTTLACLEKNEIVNSAEIKNMDEETLIELIDVRALSDSLNTHQQAKELRKEQEDYLMENVDANNLIDEL